MLQLQDALIVAEDLLDGAADAPAGFHLRSDRPVANLRISAREVHEPRSLEPIDLVTGGWRQEELISEWSGLGKGGYPTTFGATFILTMVFTEDGPVAEALLAYGESGDPASPHFADQTTLFSEKRARP